MLQIAHRDVRGTFTLSVDRYLLLGLLPQRNKKRETHFSEVGCAQLRGVSVRFLTVGVVTPKIRRGGSEKP
jgi:hypothetical protein